MEAALPVRLRAPAEFRAIAPDEVVVRFRAPPALETVKLLPPGPLMLWSAPVSKFRLALILVVVKLLSDWLAYDPLMRAKPQLAELCKQMVPSASGKYIVCELVGWLGLGAVMRVTLKALVSFLNTTEPEVMDPEIFKLPVCREVGESSAIVPPASDRIISLSPPVEIPVILKRLVAGVAEEPARYRSENGSVVTPKLSEPASAGCNTELRATVPRLLRVLLA